MFSFGIGLLVLCTVTDDMTFLLVCFREIVVILVLLVLREPLVPLEHMDLPALLAQLETAERA